MSENLFRELYSTFGDDFLEVCFNIYLVACGDRKATLIESYNYRGKTARFYADLKAFLASSERFKTSGVLRTQEGRIGSDESAGPSNLQYEISVLGGSS